MISGITSLLDREVLITAARAGVRDVLLRDGHGAATAAMVRVLNSLIGRRILECPGSPVIKAWENLAILSAEVSVTVLFQIQHAEFRRTVHMDVDSMFPENVLAVEIMGS